MLPKLVVVVEIGVVAIVSGISVMPSSVKLVVDSEVVEISAVTVVSGISV